MKIFVTGAAGFIGSNLVPVLLEQGHTIAILKKTASPIRRLEKFKNDIAIYESDTYSAICSGLKNFMPGAVIHLAALYINKHTPENITDLIASNITLGAQVLEAMAENKVSRFLNIGTRWQHIGNKRYCPANLYAATKEAFKDILLFYGRNGIKHKTLELCDTFGSGDTRKKILDLFLAACQKNEPLDLTPGEQILDLSYAGDICRYIASNINVDSFFDNKIVSLSGTKIKLKELGEFVESQFKKQGLFKWGAKPYRENEVMNPPLYYHAINLNQKSLRKYIEENVSE
jgi:nucleoside-diphosphate-sugar epimerase